MRLYANSLVKQGQTMPVHRWTQGVAQMLNAGLGGYFSGQADQQQRALQNQGAQGEATANSIVNPSAQSNDQPQSSPSGSSYAEAGNTGGNTSGLSAKDQYANLKSLGATDNEAALLTGAATSESGLDPTASHDEGTGYGLYGHRGDRLTALKQFAGTDTPTYEQQNQFALNELRSRPEGAMANGAQTPQDLTNAEMYFERPKGFTPKNPTGGLNYQGRLSDIQRVQSLAAPTQVASVDPNMNMGLTPEQAKLNSGAVSEFAGNHPDQVAQSATPDVNAYAPGSIPQGAFTRAGPVPANLNSALPTPPGVGNVGSVPNIPPQMGGGTPATAAPQGAPAVAAMASALRGGAPLQGGGPVTPQTISALRGQSAQVDPRQVGAILSNPMVSPETKQMVRQYFTPQMMEGPFGSRQLGTQSQIMAGQSLAPAPGPGITGTVGAGPASVPVTTNLGPSGPVSTPLVPSGATPQGPIKSGGGTAFSPASPIGQMATDAGKIATINNNVSAVGAAQTAEYQKAREEMEPTRQAAYNLHSLSTELDKGVPQGPGASEYAKGGAMFNFAAKLLGVDTSDINSPTSVIQLINKYGTGQSINLAGRIREGKPTNYDLETAKEVSPGSEMDPKAAAHLTDNLARLNDLYYKQLNDKAQYYEDHQSQPNPLSGWSQSWQQKISGKNAVPLSKDPIWSGEIDGIPTDKVLTSDPKGFTYMRKGTWK